MTQPINNLRSEEKPMTYALISAAIFFLAAPVWLGYSSRLTQIVNLSIYRLADSDGIVASPKPSLINVRLRTAIWAGLGLAIISIIVGASIC